MVIASYDVIYAFVLAAGQSSSAGLRPRAAEWIPQRGAHPQPHGTGGAQEGSCKDTYSLHSRFLHVPYFFMPCITLSFLKTKVPLDF